MLHLTTQLFVEWHNQARHLTSICYQMLDKGALHVTRDLHLLVSEAVHGSKPHLSRLRERHGDRIHTPQRTTYYPDGEVVTWHVNEVFRGPARE